MEYIKEYAIIHMLSREYDLSETMCNKIEPDELKDAYIHYLIGRNKYQQVEPSNANQSSNLGPPERYEEALKEFNTSKAMLEARSHENRRKEFRDEDVVLYS